MKPQSLALTGLWLVLRVVLAGVFIYAGAIKLGSPEALASSIARFRLLPDLCIHPLALGLPPFEILSGLALLAGPWKRQAAFNLGGLCLVFLIALVTAAARGIEVDCSCFGSAARTPMGQMIARDLLLLAAAAAVYLHAARAPSSGLNRTPVLRAFARWVGFPTPPLSADSDRRGIGCH